MPLRHKIFVWNNNSYLFSLLAWSMNFHTIHWTSSQWTIHYWTQGFRSHNMYIINVHLGKKKLNSRNLDKIWNILKAYYLHNNCWKTKGLLYCHLFFFLNSCSKPLSSQWGNKLFIPFTAEEYVCLFPIQSSSPSLTTLHFVYSHVLSVIMFPKFSVLYFTKGRKKALFKDKRGVGGGREKREKERLRESEQKERRWENWGRRERRRGEEERE